jgi:alanine racemase
MPLTLHVDGERWRAHLRATAERHGAGVVPVAKGNGYGFGLRRLAREAATLGVDTLAVGTYDELGKVSTRFAGDLMVLSPWRPFGTAGGVEPSDRLVHTVSRL